jgi:hypothetical protein
VTQKGFWRVLLVAVIGLALAIPARADSDTLNNNARNIAIGIGVAAAAVIVVLVIVIHHEAVKGRTITGCVSSGAGGMTITNEKDHRVYALVGGTEGIVAGERMKLHGQRLYPPGDAMPSWETTKVARDFGVCRP